MDKQKLNAQELIALQKHFARLYETTELTGLSSREIQITTKGMEEIAPLTSWTLNIARHDEEYPYLHQITIDGTKFISISAEPIHPLEDIF